MIYITGDTHGEIDISKLASKNFPRGNSLTKDDYVIIKMVFLTLAYR